MLLVLRCKLYVEIVLFKIMLLVKYLCLIVNIKLLKVFVLLNCVGWFFNEKI